MSRCIAPLLVAIAALVIVSNAVYAADKTHEGKIVSVSEGKLVMTDQDGKNEHSHKIGAAVKITLDGKAAKLSDLKAGDHIKVTQDDTSEVTAVAATRAAKK